MQGIRLRVRGDYACFTRPEMKGERVSYDVMTPSAARGILDAIYRKPSIRWVVTGITVLNPIVWDNVRRNEVWSKVSPRAVSRAMADGVSPVHLVVDEDERQQRASLLLRSVDYIIQAEFEYTGADDRNDGKHLEIFNRRAAGGQCFHRPYLGCREFPAMFEPVADVPACHPSLVGERDLGYMLYDLDYGKDMAPMFYRPRMVDGHIDVRSAWAERGVK